MTCKTCAHALKKGAVNYECRRYPPTRSRTDRFTELGDFPIVHESQQCGEFSEKPQAADENAPFQEKPSTKRRKNEPATSA